MGKADKRSAPSFHPQHRVIVLGASNIQRGLPFIAEHLSNRLPRPLEAWFVCGHGRSYGRTSNVAGFQLPGISNASWRQRLNESIDIPASAIVTDVGNDLLYGSPPNEIVAWVAQCVADLSTSNTNVLLLGPPVRSCQSMSKVKFYILRSLLFPGSRLSYRDAQDALMELDAGLQQLAQQHGCHWHSPEQHWYGWDPIHVHRKSIRLAWSQWLQVWEDGRSSDLLQDVALELSDRLRLRLARRETQRFLGWNQGRRQPSWVHPKGIQVSFF